MFGKAHCLAGLRISECKVFGYSQSYKKRGRYFNG